MDCLAEICHAGLVSNKVTARREVAAQEDPCDIRAVLTNRKDAAHHIRERMGSDGTDHVRRHSGVGCVNKRTGIRIVDVSNLDDLQASHRFPRYSRVRGKQYLSPFPLREGKGSGTFSVRPTAARVGRVGRVRRGGLRCPGPLLMASIIAVASCRGKRGRRPHRATRPAGLAPRDSPGHEVP